MSYAQENKKQRRFIPLILMLEIQTLVIISGIKMIKIMKQQIISPLKSVFSYPLQVSPLGATM